MLYKRVGVGLVRVSEMSPGESILSNENPKRLWMSGYELHSGFDNDNAQIFSVQFCLILNTSLPFTYSTPLFTKKNVKNVMQSCIFLTS